ncbi:hypothetical protein H072_6380 [Dactylellina haptotyla CBS 200.50]|uniref:Uncharacterized protein n=1 Tax=Dactylellina haptotyla (strain CBS 200.50) TaxID=1284197 RepID=S8AAP3_DACHA|nr:hypothetical protein H072_6380 [Dactylellina haptotyla CBS 200.50]
MRPAQRFISLGVFLFFVWYLFLRSSPPKDPVPQTDDIPAAKVKKFLKWRTNKERPVIFTIADKSSIDNLHNIHEKLQLWGRTDNFVAFCLDEDCNTMHADGVRRIDVSMVRGGRDVVLIQLALQLTEDGHSFLHVDSDICFTGTHDPFSRMFPLTNDNWDVQFMEEDNKLDPGYWFSKPTSETLAYLRNVATLQKDKANKGVSSTYLLREGLRGLSVRYHLLDKDLFKSWSDRQAWEAQNFATEPQIDLLIKGTTAIHFTCIDKSVRSYFGKLFGGWSDYNGYYSNVRGRYLSIRGISGTKDQILNFIALAVQLALHSGRILILPYHVEIIQKRMKHVGPDLVPEYIRIPTFPLYRVIDINSLDPILEYVEASFPLNREKYTDAEIFVADLVLDETLLEHESDQGYPRIVNKVREMGSAGVVALSLEGFEMRNAVGFEKVGQYVDEAKLKLKVCKNIDEKETACGKRCT